MMKSFKKLLILPMVVFLFSCEGNTDKYYHVKNESSDTIRLVAEGSWYQTSIDTLIMPESFCQIYWTSQRGGNSYEDYDPGYVFLRFEITNTNQDTCRQDFYDNQAWYSGVSEISKTPSNYRHDYVFTVKDEHFK